jgi:hypothetical protein
MFEAYCYRPQVAAIMAEALARRYAPPRPNESFGTVYVTNDSGVVEKGWFYGGKPIPTEDTAGLFDDWRRFIGDWASNWWRR